MAASGTLVLELLSWFLMGLIPVAICFWQTSPWYYYRFQEGRTRVRYEQKSKLIVWAEL